MCFLILDHMPFKTFPIRKQADVEYDCLTAGMNSFGLLTDGNEHVNLLLL